MGDEETMKMLAGENLRIMVGGQVVGMAKEAKFSISEDDASTKEFSDPWRTPNIKQSWDISCGAIVQEPSQALRDMWNDMMRGKMDVTIEQKVGKLPRKMKKALHSKRMTKWKRKVAAYINRRQIRIHDAEMVVTPDQFDTLKAAISGAKLGWTTEAGTEDDNENGGDAGDDNTNSGNQGANNNPPSGELEG